MYLLRTEGEATEAKLLQRFGGKRTAMRNFRRRKLAPLMGYRYTRDKETGKERRVETGVEMIEVVDGMVRLLPQWREALERHREENGEIEDNRLQAERYRNQSQAYRERDKTPAGTPGKLRGKEANRESLRRVNEREREITRRRRKRLGGLKRREPRADRRALRGRVQGRSSKDKGR
jgi:hypothetical protein